MDIDDLLILATLDQLKVRVEALSIDLITHTIAATALYVEVDGKVSVLDTVFKTFTLTYQTSKTILVDYHAAEIEGGLSGTSNVEVRLNDFDGFRYRATEIEVQ